MKIMSEHEIKNCIFIVKKDLAFMIFPVSLRGDPI